MAAAVTAHPVSSTNKRSAPKSPVAEPGFQSHLPISTARRQASGGNLKQHRPQAARSESSLSVSSSGGARTSRKPKSRRLNETQMLTDELEMYNGEHTSYAGAEDYLEDLVRLPISDELLSSRLREERTRDAATASQSSLASSLVFGVRPSKSTGALEILGTPRQASVDDLARSKRGVREESLGPAIPGSVAYGMVSSTSLALSRSSSSQSSAGIPPVTPPAALAPPLPINSLSKSLPSRLPVHGAQRSGAVPSPRAAKKAAVSAAQSAEEASRTGTVSTRSRSNTGNLKKPRTPMPKSPSTGRTHARSRSETFHAEATPPWEAAAPPLLYRSPDQKSTTLTPEGPKSHDELVIPSVARRLLAEQMEAGESDDGLITA